MTVPWKNIDLSWVERRLRSASDSTESVHTLSAWALKNKDHYAQIVEVWLRVLKTVTPEQRVVLFYLVNEVVQTCHKKNALEYKDCFKKIFMQAIPFVRIPHIKPTIERILNVWLTREVYETSFVNQLIHLLNNDESQPNGEYEVFNDTMNPTVDEDQDDDDDSDILEDVKVTDARILIMRVKRLEDDLSLLEDEGFHFVPDKEQIESDSDVSADILERLNLVVNQLEELVTTRERLLIVLNSASCLLHLEAKEANIVASAYKNYASRITSVKIKLAEKLQSLKSCSFPIKKFKNDNKINDVKLTLLDTSSEIPETMEPTVIYKSDENPTIINKPASENNLTSLLSLFKQKSLESIETIPITKPEIPLVKDDNIVAKLEIANVKDDLSATKGEIVTKKDNDIHDEKLNIIPDKDFMKDPMAFLNRLLSKPNKAPSLPDILLPPISNSSSMSNVINSLVHTTASSPSPNNINTFKTSSHSSPSDDNSSRTEDAVSSTIRNRFRKRKMSVDNKMTDQNKDDFGEEDSNHSDKKVRSNLDDRINKLLKGDGSVDRLSSPESNSSNKSPYMDQTIDPQPITDSQTVIEKQVVSDKQGNLYSESKLQQSITYNTIMSQLPQSFPYHDVEMLSGIFRIIDNEDGSKELFQMPADFDQSQFTYEEQLYIKPADGCIQQPLPNPYLIPPPIATQTPYPIIAKPPPMAPIYHHPIPPPILPPPNPYINPIIGIQPSYRIPPVAMHYPPHIQPNATIVHVNVEGLKRIEKVKSTRAVVVDHYRDRDAKISEANIYRPKHERKSILTEIKQVIDTNEEPQKIPKVYYNRTSSANKSSLISLTDGEDKESSLSRFKVNKITDDDIIRANVIAIKTDDRKLFDMDIETKILDVVKSPKTTLMDENKLDDTLNYSDNALTTSPKKNVISHKKIITMPLVKKHMVKKESIKKFKNLVEIKPAIKKINIEGSRKENSSSKKLQLAITKKHGINISRYSNMATVNKLNSIKTSNIVTKKIKQNLSANKQLNMSEENNSGKITKLSSSPKKIEILSSCETNLSPSKLSEGIIISEITNSSPNSSMAVKFPLESISNKPAVENNSYNSDNTDLSSDEDNEAKYEKFTQPLNPRQGMGWIPPVIHPPTVIRHHATMMPNFNRGFQINMPRRLPFRKNY